MNTENSTASTAVPCTVENLLDVLALVDMRLEVRVISETAVGVDPRGGESVVDVVVADGALYVVTR